MPSYAQAVFTGAAAEFLYDGSLVMADENTTFAMVTDNSDIDAADATSDSTNYRHSPLLWAGQPNILAIARSFESAFLITLAVHTPVNQSLYLASHFAVIRCRVPYSSEQVQRNSNAALNLVTDTAIKTAIRIPGITTALHLDARLQGSVYVYRNDTGGAPLLYQLDTWHEASHPSYWASEGFVIEAELFSGHLSRLSASVLLTERMPGSTEGDFRGFRTSVDLSAAARTGVAIAYPLAEHGIGRGGGGGGWRVRLLMRIDAGQSGTETETKTATDKQADPWCVNGVPVVLESAGGSATGGDEQHEGWVWRVAENVLIDSSVVLTGGADGGGWVDQLEIVAPML